MKIKNAIIDGTYFQKSYCNNFNIEAMNQSFEKGFMRDISTYLLEEEKEQIKAIAKPLPAKVQPKVSDPDWAYDEMIDNKLTYDVR